MTVYKVNNRPVKTWNGLVNDLFAGFENNFPATFPKHDAASVPVNISENEGAYLLDVAAPGRNKAFFGLHVANNSLTISYEEKSENDVNNNQKVIRNEFSTLDFKRSFSLDEKINTEAIEAKYENGVLKVTLPKKEEVKPETKQISVQ